MAKLASNIFTNLQHSLLDLEVCTGQKFNPIPDHPREHQIHLPIPPWCKCHSLWDAFSIYQYLPDATMSNARGGQTGLKVIEKTYLSPQFSRKWRSSLFFKILSDVAVTICSGKQFQLSHILLEKANFPISKLNLLLYNFNVWWQVFYETSNTCFI